MTYSTQSADLDRTISALQEDLTALPMNDAMAIIESWQQQLQGNDIAEDLGELKQAIQSGDTDSIINILSDLGEDTNAMAAELPGDIADKVQRLGALLSQAAGGM